MSKYNYLDRVLYMFPDIQNVMYWHTAQNGEEWKNPYDGLEWNSNIFKPSQAMLDAITDEQIDVEKEAQRKQERDALAVKDLGIIANYNTAKTSDNTLTLSDYLDKLEQLQQNL